MIILRGSASQYFCEACNKDFKDQAAKAEHFAEHIKCGFPGCMFEGHMLVIETHIKNAHGNGIGKSHQTPNYSWGSYTYKNIIFGAELNL